MAYRPMAYSLGYDLISASLFSVHNAFTVQTENISAGPRYRVVYVPKNIENPQKAWKTNTFIKTTGLYVTI